MKLTESRLRLIVKEELQKVLNENIQDLLKTFDEVRYTYGASPRDRIIKYKGGKEVGDLTVTELKQIFEYIDQKKSSPTTLNDLYRYTDWDEQTTMDEALGSFDEQATADTISRALFNKPTKLYKKEEIEQRQKTAQNIYKAGDLKSKFGFHPSNRETTFVSKFRKGKV